VTLSIIGLTLAKHTIHTHHITTEKVKTKAKTPFALPKTVVTHYKEEKHLHPDLATAWQKVGHEVPDAPKSGLGKDPRKDFEDEHWTEAQKAGHQAYIEAVQKKDLVKSEKGSPESTSAGKVSMSAEKSRENAAKEIKKGPALVTPVNNKGDEGPISKLPDKWTKGDNDQQQVETSKPSAKSPRSGKVSKLAQKFASEPSSEEKSTSPKLTRLEEVPGKVSGMAKLWTNMERKDSAPPSEEKLGTEDTSKGLVSDHVKSFEVASVPTDQKEPGEAVQEVSDPEYEQHKKGVKENGPSKHASVEEIIQKMEEGTGKSLPEPDIELETPPKDYQEYLAQRRKRRAKLGLPPSTGNYGRYAKSQSSHPELTHLTKDRARPPKKNTSSDA
jgi:hypothetical protein